MEIISVNPSRRNNRLIWLKFSDGSLYPFPVDDYVLMGLKKTDIDETLLTDIQTRSARFILREYSLRQITISPKIRTILSPKLRQYSHKLNLKFKYPEGLVSGLISEVLDWLESQNLLDEKQYIDYFIRRHRHQSAVQTTFQLRRLGLDPHLEMAPETDKITTIIEKKYHQSDFDDYKIRNKITAALYRKGFALDDIKTAIDDFRKKLIK